MDLTTIRERLIDQHQTLRQHIAKLLSLTVIDARGELEFRLGLADLSDELARHNREEERLLSAIVPTLDAWGPVRQRLMDEHHAREHQAQLKALRSLVDMKPQKTEMSAAIRLAQRSLGEILKHMDREEREILHPDVLRDDACAIAMDAE
jgi:hypothetical protein